MMPLFRRDFRIQVISLVGICLGSFGFVWLYISIYPLLHQHAQSYIGIINSFPKGLSQAFGIDSMFLANEQSYLSGEMYSFIWPLLAIMLVISRTGKLVSGEKDKGTLGFLITQPLPRYKIYLAKYFVSCAAVALFIVASIVACIPLSKLYKIEFTISHFFIFSAIGFLFSISILSLSFMVSVITDSKEKFYGITASILMLMYGAFIASGSVNSLSWMKFGSFFYYLNANSALSYGNITKISLLVFGISSFVFAGIGLITFKRKDLYI